MYHILLSLALIASQNQVQKIKHNSPAQNFAPVTVETKTVTTTDETPTDELQLGEEVIVPESKNTATNGNGEQDLISQLKKQTALEEEALKPDLESLGLDKIDDVQNSLMAQKPSVPVSPTPQNPNVPLGDDILSQLQNTASNAAKSSAVKPEKELATKTDSTVKSEEKNKPKAADIKKIDPRLPVIATTTETKEEVAKKEEPKDQPVVETQVADKGTPVEEPAKPESKDSKLSGLISKPLEKIKGLMGKKSEEKPQDVAKTTGDKAEEKVADKEEKKDKTPKNKKEPKVLTAEEKERIEKRKQQQIALAELKQRQKAEKIENLRQKYLQKDDSDIYNGITNYQIISSIVPKEKVPPKFLNSEIAPPLLIRYKSPDNKHHPAIVSNAEKIDFMFKAVAENRIDEFNALYSQIKNPNIKNSYGDTLLTLAVLMRRHDAISSLLAKGANPDAKNDLGYTPLNIAIEMADYKAAETLIDMGAKVNLIDELGRTYLMQSSRVGSLQITDLLIRKGVDVNAEDRNGVTALAIALKYKKDIIAKYLLKYGAKSWIKKDFIEDDTPMINDLFDKWK